MAKQKKKAAKKAAPKKAKTAPKKAAPMKSAAPKKAAPKKAAPKQAAPKKAAPKQAAPKKAPMKAAPKHAAPMKAAPKQVTAKAAPATRAAKAPAPTNGASNGTSNGTDTSTPTATAKDLVLRAFRSFYTTDDWPEAKILETDPNGFDLDPGPFYEELGAMFGVADDPENQYFGGFGGKISQTIAFIEKSWDGKVRSGPDLSSEEKAIDEGWA